MDVSTPLNLDLACPQAKTEIEKHVHMLWERGVDKNKIKHGTFIIELLSYTSHE